MKMTSSMSVMALGVVLTVLLFSPAFGMGGGNTLQRVLGMINDGCPAEKGARYKITFYNTLSRENPSFRTIVPPTGLVYSPMTVVTHTARSSLLTVGGYATKGVEMVCETGNNTRLIREAFFTGMWNSVAGAKGPVPSGGSFTEENIYATCKHSRMTAIAMIAPSPDWIVQINSVPLVENGMFVEKRSGPLFAYDCGTDDSGDFTPPSDLSLDRPTQPRKTIALLSDDDTDPFGKVPVGFYIIEKMK